MNPIYEKLSKLTLRWGAIQEENASHRHLVTDEEWSSWEKFNEQTVETLKNVIKDYDANNGSVSIESQNAMDALEKTIAGAKHLNERELEERLNPPASKLLHNFKG